MVKQYTLGKEAHQYIRYKLSYGTTLFRFALALPIDDGNVMTFLPDRINPNLILRFDVGGIWDGAEDQKAADNGGNGEWSDSELTVAKCISAFLRSSEDACAVFEDYVHEPDSVWLKGQQFLKAVIRGTSTSSLKLCIGVQVPARVEGC